MAETSGLWSTSATPAGHQVSSYTQAIASTMLEIAAACSGFEGVAPGYLNELACSDGGANTVDVATGGAMVDGKYYKNDALIEVNIPSAVGGGNTRIDRIVVRATWANFEAEVTRIAGTDAASPTAPAITQTSGTTYDIQLCQVLVDISGAVTVTDERKWAIVDTDESTLEDSAGALRVKDLGITTAKLAADAVTGAKIADDSVDSEHYVAGSIDLEHMSANSIDSDQYVDGSIDTAHLADDAVDDTKVGNRVAQFHRRQGGDAAAWGTQGTTTYTPTTVRTQAGRVQHNAGAVSSGNFALTFPTAFSNTPIVFVTPIDGTALLVCTASSVTASGCLIYWANWDASVLAAPAQFAWLAFGPE